jgi:L-fuconolactonase
VSLTDPALRDTIESYRAAPGGHLLVGVRDQVQGQADDYLMRPDVHAGLRTSYADVKERLVLALGGQPSDIFAGTAIKTYGLELTGWENHRRRRV